MISFPLKVYILLLIIFVTGCTNSTSNKEKYNTAENKNFIIKIPKQNSVELKSCTLSIPLRYKLIKQLDDDVVFNHDELEDKEWSEPKNILLTHRIRIAKRIKLDEINEDTYKDIIKDFKFLSKKKISDIKIYRFKAKYKMDDTVEEMKRTLELLSENNTLYIYGSDFFMSIRETDEYIDEIYKMIEDCASQMSAEKKK